MDSWSRIINTTIRNYIREREVNVLRNRKLTALLKKKGRFSFNWSGIGMDYKVKYKRVKLTPYADGDTLEFSRKDRYKTAFLDWRGYSATDSMTKGEFLQNRSKEAIIKVYDEIATDLMDDMDDNFSEEFYVDGTQPGNAKRMHGIESFLQCTANAGNGAATPTGNFAGLSCVPGQYGGTWNPGGLPAWPNGRGDAQYDFYSPIVVDYNDHLFSTDGLWSDACVEAISFGIIKSKKSKSQKGMLDVIMVDDEMYRQYIALYRQKERIFIERQADKSPLVALGFGDVTNQDGVDVTWEYGITPSTGYGFNCDMMECRSMQAQVFVAEGPEMDLATKSWRFSIDFFGNTVWNPKFFVAFKPLTGTPAGLSLRTRNPRPETRAPHDPDLPPKDRGVHHESRAESHLGQGGHGKHKE